LARRIRLLFLDARAAIVSAPLVAECMAKEMKKDRSWIDNQIADFTKLASGYIL
jgi:glycerol-3-phosphate dehydrogenase